MPRTLSLRNCSPSTYKELSTGEPVEGHRRPVDPEVVLLGLSSRRQAAREEPISIELPESGTRVRYAKTRVGEGRDITAWDSHISKALL